MKKYIIATLFVFCVLVFSPFSSLLITDSATNSEKTATEYNTEDIQTDNTVRVLQASTNNVLNLDINDYLIGAVASEMPASFSEEALKAQAVASYTYLKRIMSDSDNASNEISDISDDSTVHQGFLTDEEMKERWGKKYDSYYKKIENAVKSVEGEYIAYNSEPIIAVFHGLSHGYTNNSEEIWGNSLPYLVSVEAPGDKLSSDLVSENVFTKDEFSALAASVEGVVLDSNNDLITVTETSENGFALKIKIGVKELSSTDLRSIFSLKSPNFTVKETESTVCFTVYGKGHGLGMSQYSADFMARQGADYKEILAHFYTGTEIVKE